MPNISFDSTYEGLKRGVLFGARYPMGCFDSTYEGLKPGRGKRHAHTRCRFDSTYEGLKHRLTTIVLAALRVSTVPMRA